MTAFETEQEEFWAGSFGDAYIERNISRELAASNLAFFSDILKKTQPIESVLELGCNVGMNLRALRALLPASRIDGVEINQQAAKTAEQSGADTIFPTSLLTFAPERTWDLTFTKGVLIHLNPDRLATAYDQLYHCSKRYILVAEYYNPTPVSIPYRGNADRLFKRDFAGEIMERFSDLTLTDYGFVWKKDPHFPQDDITWFLLQK